jgi:formate dehydrogenase subunit gamma
MACDLLRHRSRIQRAAVPSGPKEQAPGAGKSYERFNIHQRLQHLLLAVSFTSLIATGWPLRFPELAISQQLARLAGGPAAIGLWHRGLACLLLATCLYHIAYLFAMYARGQRSRSMLPARRDFSDAWQDLRYFFGRRAGRPAFGRYSWIEKFEYYAVAWGCAIMALSGFVLWAPQHAVAVMPAWIVQAAVLVHDYEALLAGLAIFLWHFYWVHLHPAVFPMNSVWLSGRMSEEEMLRHHPRELDTLQEERWP